MIIKVPHWHGFGGYIDTESWDGYLPKNPNELDPSIAFDAILAFNEINETFMRFHGPKLFISGEPLRHLDDFTRDHLLVLPSTNVWPYWEGSLEQRHYPYGMSDEASLRLNARQIRSDRDRERPSKVCLINLMKPDHTKRASHDLQGLREAFLMSLAKRGISVDIWGKGNWPAFTAKSQFLNYRGILDSKFQGLRQYQFTVCVENTRFPGYITEKPYHAICCGTIPIYAGGKANGEVWKYFNTSFMKEITEQTIEGTITLMMAMSLEDRIEARSQMALWLSDAAMPRLSLNSRMASMIVSKLEDQR